jgi:hypothetical protein
VKVSLTFAAGLLITLAVAFTVVKYLTTPLRQQLQELCGNAERAAFWTSFSNVMLVLTPAVFAMLVDPWAGACDPPLVGVVSRVKWGLIGLAMSVLMLARVLGRFIPRTPVLPPSLPAAPKLGGEI